MSDRRLRVFAVRHALWIAAAGALLTACGETVTQLGVGDVVELRVSTDSAEVPIDSTVKVLAYPIDVEGTLLVGLDVGWLSGNALVATVDGTGAITGVASGSTHVVAQVGAVVDTTFVTVDVPPVLTLSKDSVGFDVVAGAADPAPDSIDITNTGGLTLRGLGVDSVVYTVGATDWLAFGFDSSVGPATLELMAVTATVTTAGTHVASLWLSATDAVGSPAEVMVTLQVAPGAPASGAFQIFAGNSQTATTETNVTVAPTVVLRDQFDNPVPGATVAFSASGGGSVGAAADTTDTNGRASTSWTVSVTGHTLAANGTFQNTLTASTSGLTPLVFTGFARYSFAAHVDPIFAVNCNGCHGSGGSSGGLNFDGTVAADYGQIVNVIPNCDAGLGALYRRVSNAGGVAAAETYSILIRKLDPNFPAIGTCGAHGGGELTNGAPQLAIFHAWIRNGAPNN